HTVFIKLVHTLPAESVPSGAGQNVQPVEPIQRGRDFHTQAAFLVGLTTVDDVVLVGLTASGRQPEPDQGHRSAGQRLAVRAEDAHVDDGLLLRPFWLLRLDDWRTCLAREGNWSGGTLSICPVAPHPAPASPHQPR